MSVSVWKTTPSSVASLTRPSGTARVPPMGYQMPSSICMWPMAQRMAGEASGEEPTYWTKWSSIWAALASGMNSRMVPATVLPRRMRMTSRRTLRSKAPLDVHGVAHGADGAPEEEAVGDGVELLGVLEELEVAGAHAGPDALRAWRPSASASSSEVEAAAVFEEAAPLRVEADHGDVVVEVAVGLGEDLAEHGGLDEDGGAHVEAEALLVELGGLAAEPGVLLEDLDLVPAGGEGAGGGEAGEAGADDADVHADACVLLAGVDCVFELALRRRGACVRPLPALRRRLRAVGSADDAGEEGVVVRGRWARSGGCSCLRRTSDGLGGGHFEQAFGAASDAEAAVRGGRRRGRGGRRWGR